MEGTRHDMSHNRELVARAEHGSVVIEGYERHLFRISAAEVPTAMEGLRRAAYDAGVPIDAQTWDTQLQGRIVAAARLLATARTPADFAHAVSAVTEAAQTLEVHRS